MSFGTAPSRATPRADLRQAAGKAARRRHLVAWTAWGLFLLSALVPTLSRALMHFADSSSWVVVCAAQGMRWASVEGDAVDLPEPGDSGAFDPCPSCLFACQPMALPAASTRLAPSPDGFDNAPEFPPSETRTASAWHAPPPRAPPNGVDLTR